MAYFPHKKERDLLNEKHKFSLATVDSFSTYSDGYPVVLASFKVKGFKYKVWTNDCCRINSETCEINDLVFVMYNPDNPNNNKRIGSFYSANKAIQIPESGWDSIPEDVINFLTYSLKP